MFLYNLLSILHLALLGTPPPPAALLPLEGILDPCGCMGLFMGEGGKVCIQSEAWMVGMNRLFFLTSLDVSANLN